MKTILTAVFCVVSVAGVGVLIPHLLYKDASNVPAKEAQVLKKEVILEDPRNVLLITKLVVRERKNDIAFVDMYTFFGFKYGELKIELNPRTKQPYR
ncbi:MAG: hypothetical protein LH702_02090 [Phormidesmis sp. CAN_BIN44]|nr:hypothetical protein [Phormidesmis sp. CAN_BIN44]